MLHMGHWLGWSCRCGGGVVVVMVCLVCMMSVCVGEGICLCMGIDMYT